MRKITQILPSWPSTPSRKIANIPLRRLEDSRLGTFAPSSPRIMWTMCFRSFANFFTISSRMWKRLPLWACWRSFMLSLRPFLMINNLSTHFLFSSKIPMLWCRSTPSWHLMKSWSQKEEFLSIWRCICISWGGWRNTTNGNKLASLISCIDTILNNKDRRKDTRLWASYGKNLSIHRLLWSLARSRSSWNSHKRRKSSIRPLLKRSKLLLLP